MENEPKVEGSTCGTSALSAGLGVAMAKWIDIGGGHEIEFVEYRGDLCAGINDKHKRPDGTDCVGFIAVEGGSWASVFAPGVIEVWRVESWEPLTLSPSLLCKTCGDHGHIRNGKWEPA